MRGKKKTHLLCFVLHSCSCQCCHTSARHRSSVRGCCVTAPGPRCQLVPSLPVHHLPPHLPCSTAVAFALQAEFQAVTKLKSRLSHLNVSDANPTVKWGLVLRHHRFRVKALLLLPLPPTQRNCRDRQVLNRAFSSLIFNSVSVEPGPPRLRQRGKGLGSVLH